MKVDYHESRGPPGRHVNTKADTSFADVDCESWSCLPCITTPTSLKQKNKVPRSEKACHNGRDQDPC